MSHAFLAFTKPSSRGFGPNDRKHNRKRIECEVLLSSSIDARKSDADFEYSKRGIFPMLYCVSRVNTELSMFPFSLRREMLTFPMDCAPLQWREFDGLNGGNLMAGIWLNGGRMGA